MQFLSKNTFFAHLTILMVLSAPEISFSQEKSATSTQFHNFASWGVNYTHSDVTMNRIGLMFSTAYTHSFTESIGVECGVQFSGSSLSYNSVLGGIWEHVAQHAVVGDIAVISTPFASAKAFQISAGASMRFRSLLSGSMFFAGVVTEKQIIGSFALGGTIKIDYSIPLGDNSHVVLRAQAHSFFPAFSGEEEVITSQFPLYNTGRSMSLGAFLRVGF